MRAPADSRRKTKFSGASARFAVLVAGLLLLISCAGAGSSICPPVIEYSAAYQARAAEELARLPADLAIGAMLADYHVMREQARACLR